MQEREKVSCDEYFLLILHFLSISTLNIRLVCIAQKYTVDFLLFFKWFFGQFHFSCRFREFFFHILLPFPSFFVSHFFLDFLSSLNINESFEWFLQCNALSYPWISKILCIFSQIATKLLMCPIDFEDFVQNEFNECFMLYQLGITSKTSIILHDKKKSTHTKDHQSTKWCLFLF